VSDWVTVLASELSHEEPRRANRGHSFRGVRGKIGFPQFCCHCGHCALKNEISILVTRIGCDYERDQRFRDWCRRRGA
jgi:hypothetical protein